ncbi:MAG: M1 family metallopeptidase [Bacteroidia bacterium]|nr:M1 family metallopeptidase [Bacteroidia bacterium]
MRKFTFFLLTITTLSAVAQEKTAELRAYQSNGNEYYWKNRMPIPGYWQQDVHYVIDAYVDDKEESITGRETLTYWNNSPDALDKVYFHLYQNAFTPGSYLSSMRESDRVKTVYGDRESQGEGTIINNLKVNNKEVKYSIDNSVMMVELNEALKPNEGVTFQIEFITYWDKDDKGNIRRRMKTFRHGGQDDREFLHFDGVHWYPRISVYDRKFGWTTDQHLGKEFYGDYGVYEVDLTFPNQYVVEATGELLNTSDVYPGDLRQKLDISNYKTPRETYSNPVPPNGSTKTWKFRAVNVHDFAFTADPTYRIGEVIWNGVKCIALAQEEHAHRWQPTAQFVADVVKTYSEKVGMLAYPKMIAADARDGMEYPMLTLDGGGFPGHKGLIAHEVGHNWFFGMVGNNETYRASLDEGFTQFLTAMSQKEIDGVNYRPNYRDDQTVFLGYMLHATNSNTARLNIHSDHFNSAVRHGGGYGQVYYKTATMLYNLQYVLGDELFSEAFKHYFDQWKICHPYWEDFRNSIIQYTKVDLNWFFDTWIEENTLIDYSVKNVKSDKNNTYHITFERKGEQMPIDFAVIDRNGKAHMYHIPNTYFLKKTKATVLPAWIGWDLIEPTYTATVHIPDGIKDVIIDPTGRLADVNRLDNTKKFPIRWRYDNLNYGPISFRHYLATYRPDIWYNAVDGVKVGGKVSGQYFGHRHKINARVLYNTGLGASQPEAITDERDLLSYQIDYTTRLKPSTNLELESRWMDGWMYHRAGLDRSLPKGLFELDIASADRRNSSYLVYQEFANMGIDNWVNLSFTRNYKQLNGGGNLVLKGQAPVLFSDYSYSSVTIELTNQQRLKKLLLRTRAFAQFIDGSSVAPEAMLQLSGANVYELMDNRYTRSIGWLTDEALLHSRGGNNVHQGGGLNLRGYSGVAATNVVGSDTFFTYAGSKGASINAELDFGNFINPKLGKLGRTLKIDPYLFTDLGVLSNQNNQHSGLRMDAGVGANFGILFNRYFTATKPLNIRIDLPFFLNRIPEEQTNYVQMRYVFGINRAF